MEYFHSHVNVCLKDSQLENEKVREAFVNCNQGSVFNELSFSISDDEIRKAIAKLKNSKASGSDFILNEMLKVGSDLLLPTLLKLFNKVLSLGKFPDSWRCSLLTPLHKKGDKSVPSNFRGIAISSNICKLFCSVLHSRLVNFSDAHNLLPNCQIGYRRNSRTTDHILTLKSVIDKYMRRCSRKRLYCCFVDFKAAFDSISRVSLAYKLLKMDIGGNFLRVLRNMYEKVLYSVRSGNEVTDAFPSKTGVKQGCILSPLLFNLFVADLPDIFTNDCDPAILFDHKLSCLMFADDLVLFSESAEGLQNALVKLQNYCDKWGLVVNLNKTKIIYFNSSRKLPVHRFELNGIEIEQVNEYCYLGIVFTSNGSFKAACNRLYLQALKALFKLQQLDIRGNIPVAIHLFNTLVLPVAMYGCEVWGPCLSTKLKPDNIYSVFDTFPIEKLNMKFCRYLLGVKRNSPNAAVRGELGLRPLLLNIISRSCKFWLRTTKLDTKSLVYKAYLQSYTDSNAWASSVKNFWCIADLPGVWINVGTTQPNKTLKILYESVLNKFDAAWLSYINRPNSNKLRTYCTFKPSHEMEPYLLFSKNIRQRSYCAKLRIGDHHLEIETGRYLYPRVPADQRFCKECTDTPVVDDEFHAILHCKRYTSARKYSFEKLSEFTSFDSMNDKEKFHFIMTHDRDREVFDALMNLIEAIVRRK